MVAMRCGMRSLVAGGGASDKTPEPLGAGVHHPGKLLPAAGAAELGRFGDSATRFGEPPFSLASLGGEAARRLGGDLLLILFYTLYFISTTPAFTLKRILIPVAYSS